MKVRLVSFLDRLEFDFPEAEGCFLDILQLWVVRTAGFEPALPNGKRILSPQRLPFRHVRSGSHGDGRSSRAIPR